MIENQYPIGPFKERVFSDAVKQECLGAIRFLPNMLEAAITNLDEAQLQTPYREGGWTVHQLVHHVADSHINAYTRFKLGLTEVQPVIRPYDEQAWALLDDVKNLPVNTSITLLYALHARWYATIRDLGEAQWARKVVRPDAPQPQSLAYYLQQYAWHGKHHVAQINYLREQQKWQQ
ncbi:YfiT family bacillithiol transferase [Niabella beijingensis]|uniref:YfiT family bacillithiol transferase n=1 Tax=Niabella beijingensis TaxID=2872700 RepID=UPI001CBF6A57|nr:putative metal-dependent hydrolase [Niabella beijingensis]MBZ4191084.1 putative metal-dependent hydrolase [Niabella beijingensis]